MSIYKTKLKDAHKFRPSAFHTFYYVLNLGLFSASMGSVLVMSMMGIVAEFRALDSQIIPLLMMVFVFYILVSLLWMLIDRIFYFGIDVTPEGIWLHNNGVCFYQWEDMIEFGENKKLFKHSLWGIHVSKAEIKQYSRIGRFLALNWTNEHFIPLDFVDGMMATMPRTGKEGLVLFKQTKLGQLIYEYAPHLFTNNSKAKLEVSKAIPNKRKSKHS